MTRVVIDASALADYLLGTAVGPAVTQVIVERDADLHVPALCDVEIAAVLRRAMRAGVLSARRASDAVIDLVDLPLTRYAHAALLGRILQLRENFTASDATYVALAEELEARLLTTDARFGRAVRAHLGLDVLDLSDG